MKIFITGVTGQIGSACYKLLARKHKVIAPLRAELDLSDIAALENMLTFHKPNIIVNAAAYTNVDGAEIDQQAALILNRDVPEALAQFCQRNASRLIHYSTDYVFSGQGELPWAETDTTDPVNFYGYSKNQGEQCIIRNCQAYYILRTSWVFSKIGKNFVKTILRLSREEANINVVSDQIGSPTSARYLARVTERAIDTEAFGTYHISCSGFTSWFDFATEILRLASDVQHPFQRGKPNCFVSSILTEQYPTLAKRPLNSRLDCTKWEQIATLSAPSWEEELLHLLEDPQLYDLI